MAGLDSVIVNEHVFNNLSFNKIFIPRKWLLIVTESAAVMTTGRECAVSTGIIAALHPPHQRGL
jgi:hypothetical protein